jgi:hypothetical protein
VTMLPHIEIDTEPYDEKYTVFKSSEPADRLDPGSYFVIRSSDLFAPSALHAYAGNIRSVLEMNQHLEHRMFTPDEEDRLAALADQLTVIAIDWERSDKDRKVPD